MRTILLGGVLLGCQLHVSSYWRFPLPSALSVTGMEAERKESVRMGNVCKTEERMGVG